MTNGKNPPLNNGGQVPEHGDPPVNADGVALPPAARLGGRTIRPQGHLVAATWLFVAVPRSDGAIPPASAAFFDGIVLHNGSGKSWSDAYYEFPASLQGAMAQVTGGPAGGYPLANYWVALYYLNGGDSVQLPLDIVPPGLVTWRQDVLIQMIAVNNPLAVLDRQA